MKKKKLKLIILALAIALTLKCCAIDGPSEESLKMKAVQLKSDAGSCNGEQVKAPSGESYILTAAHCNILEQSGSINVVTAQGVELMRRIIAEDNKSDLLLLEGMPKVDGLEIAESAKAMEHVRTFTHGKAHMTHKTEGELLETAQVKIGADEISEENCKGDKYKLEQMDGLFGSIAMCILDVSETVTSAAVTPGSSGGMVVDDSGKLVGVVSASDGNFGFLITLHDIQRFLAAY